MWPCDNSEQQVLWICDPVHGNTIKTASGYKTRKFEDVRAELRCFFDVHKEMGTHPGGVRRDGCVVSLRIGSSLQIT